MEVVIHQVLIGTRCICGHLTGACVAVGAAWHKCCIRFGSGIQLPRNSVILHKQSISALLTTIAPLIFLYGFLIIQSSLRRSTSCLSCCCPFHERFLNLAAGGAHVIHGRSWLTVQKKMQIPTHLLCLQLIQIKYLPILHRYFCFVLALFQLASGFLFPCGEFWSSALWNVWESKAEILLH